MEKTGEVARLYLVEEQPNPSTDFFVLPAVSRVACNVMRCGFAELPAPAELVGATVVFIRYVPTAWMRLVESVRPSLRALVFFMDDDVLDAGASAGMPLRYRYKLWRLSVRRREWLQRMEARLWVSTPYLLHKYAAWGPRLVLPAPLANPADVRRVFYHGSASHDAEIRWLRPVMEEVLHSDERIAFELIGGQDVYRLYRGLPRVNVVHPMKWPAYQSYIATPGRHIGLAPLLDLPFNQARSYTKFFDITRSGAVGIYTPGDAYSGIVEHEVQGLIVPLRLEDWVAAILRLALDEPFRQGLLRNAEVESKKLEESASCTSADLLK
ncbi:MAG: glycosyltransferase family 1 protein [Gammaproteobacteria bacterium]|nr:glycosyltransferase family 1 protein [Gammaproteobacteria bacterium]MBU1775183.1 glycosyltransferase family 1 protein [Gammaproteobacteria bacterium]